MKNQSIKLIKLNLLGVLLMGLMGLGLSACHVSQESNSQNNKNNQQNQNINNINNNEKVCDEPKSSSNPSSQVFKNPTCLIEDLALVESNEPKSLGKFGFVDSDGKWVIQPIFDGGYTFYNGFARVQHNDLYGFINKKGELIAPHQYEWAEDFTGTFAVVRIGKKWGLIDKTGKRVLPVEYDWVHYGRGKSGAERYLVCKNKSNNSRKCGFMDEKLNWVIPMEYDAALHFGRFGVAAVKKDGKEFYIDENGQETILPSE